MNTRLTVGLILLAAAPNAVFAQVTPVTLLQIDVENIVSYTTDAFDASKFATDPNATSLAAPPRNFAFVMAVGDVIAVNGKPARGSLVVRQQSIALSPTPSPGQGVADVVRTAVSDYLLEIQQVDGTPVGNIHCLGLSGGTSPGGAPARSGSSTVAGGTGAYLGARGQMSTSLLAGGPGPRVASVTEDPSQRRVHGAGGSVRFAVQLVPMARPEIVMTAGSPAVVHASDFSLVSTSNPAKPGEILALFASGLEPTLPNIELGTPFPKEPLAAIGGPLQVNINGTSTEVIGAVGYPGSTDKYQVNFRLPGTVHGQASLQLTSAWISGPEVQIAVQ